jgi:hypothetical protein
VAHALPPIRIPFLAVFLLRSQATLREHDCKVPHLREHGFDCNIPHWKAALCFGIKAALAEATAMHFEVRKNSLGIGSEAGCRRR